MRGTAVLVGCEENWTMALSVGTDKETDRYAGLSA